MNPELRVTLPLAVTRGARHALTASSLYAGSERDLRHSRDVCLSETKERP